MAACRCPDHSRLIPAFDAALFSREWRDAPQARFYTGAPARQRAVRRAIQHARGFWPGVAASTRRRSRSGRGARRLKNLSSAPGRQTRSAASSEKAKRAAEPGRRAGIWIVSGAGGDIGATLNGPGAGSTATQGRASSRVTDRGPSAIDNGWPSNFCRADQIFRVPDGKWLERPVSSFDAGTRSSPPPFPLAKGRSFLQWHRRSAPFRTDTSAIRRDQGQYPDRYPGWPPQAG